jgi:APA family basic amino acid/polyamine antiporter
MSSASKETAAGPGQLGLWSTVSIIVGIVIGTTIYKVPWLIFSNTADPIWGLLVWAIGGVIALIGAFCYAELATTYPKAGGDYYYLSRSFGSGTGFLFGWAQLVVVMPASIGAMATVFADYAQKAFVPRDVILSFEVPFVEGAPPIDPSFVIAACAVGLLTLTNVFGVMLGKVVQNLLTLTKVIGLGGIIVIGFCYAEPNAWEHTPKTHTLDRYNDQLTNIVGRQTVGRRAFTIERYSDPSAQGAEPEGVKGIRSELALPLFGSLAMILVMYAFGGWNDSAFVAAEVRNPRRNIPRALFLGIGIIVLVYLLVNAAYISGLGWDNVSRYNPDVPGSVIAKALDEDGAKAMQILVMISALGAVNGLVFTGARVYATLGADHILFGWMGHWRPGKRAPVMALILQGALTVFIVFAITTKEGHDGIIYCLDGINQGLAKANERLEDVLPNREIGQIQYDKTWDPEKGFEKLVERTAPVFWMFFMLTGLSLFLLREKDPGIDRPYSVPFYPLTPLLFCFSCAWMLYRSVIYVEWHCLFAFVLVLVGLPLYWLSSLIRRPRSGGPVDLISTPVARVR